MSTQWKDLRAEAAARDPEFEAGVAAARRQREARQERFQRTLAQLRKGRALTQTELAERLVTTQSEISQIERRGDLYLSTLVRYVRALGGSLRLVADLDGETFDLEIGDLLGPETAPAAPAEPTLAEAAA